MVFWQDDPIVLPEASLIFWFYRVDSFSKHSKAAGGIILQVSILLLCQYIPDRFLKHTLIPLVVF